MTTSLRTAGVRAVILDIEGTTTPIAFVYDVLFAYARAHMRTWFASRPWSDRDVQDVLSELRQEADHPLPHDREPTKSDAELLVTHFLALMDADRKSRPLKTLQGKIWEEGYACGELRGEVYPDVPSALRRWTDAGIGVGIYSSGSVLAQRLLFGRSNAGDLSGMLRWYFDTSVGAKADAESYRRIASVVSLPPGDVLFVSDVARELDAARTAGFQTALCARGDIPPSAGHPIIVSFDALA